MLNVGVGRSGTTFRAILLMAYLVVETYYETQRGRSDLVGTFRGAGKKRKFFSNGKL